MINSVDENLFTPLHYASINNQTEIINYLLSKEAGKYPNLEFQNQPMTAYK